MTKQARTAFFALLFVCILGLQVEAIAEDEVAIYDIFYETFILDALSDLSLQSGVPIIADSSVSGFVTMELDGVSLEQALRRICVPFGYTFRYMPEGYYLVGAASANNPTFALLSEVQVFKTSYVPAKTVSSLLSDFFQPFLRVDATLNTIVVTASPEMIERIGADIAQIDRPTRQVLLEVLVVELTEEARREIGTEWHWGETMEDGQDPSGALEFAVRSFQQLTAKVSHQYPSGLTSFLLSLRPMVESGKAQIHANPRIVAMDGHQADIFLGQEQSYLVVSDNPTGSQSRQRVLIQSGVTLNFLAQIGPGDEVTVRVEPEVSQAVGFNQDGFPIVSSRRANTTVRVLDGETFAIGGLLHTFTSESIAKVPVLGDLPLIGRLFRTERSESQETEIIIFVTPHILGEV